MFELGPLFLAYIDPGTGSMILQILLAGILSVSVVFRQVLISPFAFLFGKRSKKSASGDLTRGEEPEVG